MGQQKSLIQRKYLQGETIFHPQIQTLSIPTVFEDQHQAKKIQYTMTIYSKQAVQRWTQLLIKYYQDVETQFLYLPNKYIYRSHYSMCGGIDRIYVEYDYFPMTLHSKIRQIEETDNFFKESFIWLIIYIYSSAITQLNKYQKKIAKFSLQSCFVNSTLTDIRIGTDLTFFSGCITLDIAAPEENRKYSRWNSNNDIELSSVYCVGILVAMAMTKHIPRYWMGSKIREEEQLQVLQKAKNVKIYSNTLRQVLEKICKDNPVQRYRSNEINEISKLQLMKQEKNDRQNKRFSKIKKFSIERAKSQFIFFQLQ